MLRPITNKATVRGFIMVVAMLMLIPVSRVSAQEQRIRLDRTEITAGELFAEIERQSGLMFAINHANFDTSKILSVPADAGVTELVRQALEGTPMTYRITGNHILIVSRREEEAMKRSHAAVKPASFYDLSNRVYDNPDFEKDLAVYNASVADRYQPTETLSMQPSDSVQVIYIPRADSVFTYPDSTFPLDYMKTGASLPESMSYLRNAPAKYSLKINLPYAATLTPNISFEIGLGRRTSLDLTGSYNPWKLKGTREDNRKLVHWTARPEFRYWLCERSNGHFFGASVFYWQYNISRHDLPLLFEREYRYEGNAVGAGLSYGYHLPLAKRWGLEFNVGAGVVFMNYDRYSCAKCNRDKEELTKTYFGPTDLGIKLVFIIK